MEVFYAARAASRPLRAIRPTSRVMRDSWFPRVSRLNPFEGRRMTSADKLSTAGILRPPPLEINGEQIAPPRLLTRDTQAPSATDVDGRPPLGVVLDLP